MSYALSGRTALITGSTSGIGRACEDTLAQHGAHVLVSDRHTGRGERAVAEIRAAGGTAVAFLASDEAAYIHGAVLPVDGGAIAA
jgi:NAD(P)-dependent dehydrogenase (short-subunit alcohol dehydrogenase family)